MTVIEQIKSFFESLETKDFYKYIGIFLAACSLIGGGVVFQYYRKVSSLKKHIAEINEYREDDVRVILQQALQVKQQRAEVDTILSEDVDFKIGGYFKDLLDKLKLTEKKVSEETSQVDREDNYRESELNAKFEDMNMQQLTELLQELERNKRISTKQLDITKSKKKADTLEVQITIGTLLPITEIPE